MLVSYRPLARGFLNAVSIRFLVENSYVTFGGKVFKQEIGIAMGLLPAGAIASLVCYTYELDYLNRCLKKWKSMDPTDAGYAEMHARTLFAMLSRRYIDDNLYWRNPKLREI